MKKHEIVRLFLSTLALASSLAVSILSVSTSSASATPALPHLTLSNLPNQNWEVAGAGFPAGQSGLLEVYAVGGPTSLMPLGSPPRRTGSCADGTA